MFFFTDVDNQISCVAAFSPCIALSAQRNVVAFTYACRDFNLDGFFSLYPAITLTGQTRLFDHMSLSSAVGAGDNIDKLSEE